MRNAAILPLLITPLTQAAVVPAYSNWESMDDVTSSVFQVHDAPRRTGLTFESGLTGELVSVSVALMMFGSAPRSVGVEVWTLDSIGLPQSVIALGMHTVAGTTGISTQTFDLDFQLSGTIDAGQTYAVVMFNTFGPSFSWNTTKATPQGNIVSRLPSGEWKTQPAGDAGGMPTVRINVIPTPGGLALLPILAASLRRRRI